MISSFESLVAETHKRVVNGVDASLNVERSFFIDEMAVIYNMIYLNESFDIRYSTCLLSFCCASLVAVN